MVEKTVELIFLEKMEEFIPLVNWFSDTLKAYRMNLKNLQYRIESYHSHIVNQEKQITNNKALIEDANVRASKIIGVAQDRAKEIEKGLQIRVAEINHMEREVKKKLADADKKLWESQQKETVKA